MAQKGVAALRTRRRRAGRGQQQKYYCIIKAEREEPCGWSRSFPSTAVEAMTEETELMLGGVGRGGQ